MYFPSSSWGKWDDDEIQFSFKIIPIVKEEDKELKKEFEKLHKAALMVLIDGALDRKDQELFNKLIGEYHRLYGE